MSFFDNGALGAANGEGRNPFVAPGEYLVKVISSKEDTNFEGTKAWYATLEIVESSREDTSPGQIRTHRESSEGKGGVARMTERLKGMILALKGIDPKDPRVNAAPGTPQAAAVGATILSYWLETNSGASPLNSVVVRLDAQATGRFDKHGAEFTNCTYRTWDGSWRPTKRAPVAAVAAPPQAPAALLQGVPYQAPAAAPPVPWGNPGAAAAAPETAPPVVAPPATLAF